MDDDGIVWDCMPVDQQPGISSKQAGEILTAPGYPADDSLTPISDRNQLFDTKDRFGNDVNCPDGHVPVKRLTLEALSQFRSLAEFNQKRPTTASLTVRDCTTLDLATADTSHRYVYIKQVTPNRGGGSILSTWQPAINSNAGQLLSLSQVWVAGGSGAQTQTIEVGWQVCPTLWNTSKPVLFIYWTADNYASTGSYNLQGGAFVQTNNRWRLGGTLSPISVAGGDQFDIIMEWFFLNNAWWLYLNKQAVGYYPRTVFKGGVLTTGADAVLTGGETSGSHSWGAMGSGIFAQQRFGKSAYIRNARLMAMDGSIHNLNMSPCVTSPNCYSFTQGDNPAWGSSFFYGGPGGNNC